MKVAVVNDPNDLNIRDDKGKQTAIQTKEAEDINAGLQSVRVDGVVHHHIAEDDTGRWVYAPMK